MDDTINVSDQPVVRALTQPGAGRIVSAHRDLQAFSAFVIAQPTVTRALELWRHQHGFGGLALTAVLLASVAPVTADAALSADLQLLPGERVLRRHVALQQGPARLVIADNFFVPSRLSPVLAETLLTGDVPFGKLIAPLGGYRIHRSAAITTDATSLRHRAVVCLGDGTRVAVVNEQFLPAVLDWA